MRREGWGLGHCHLGVPFCGPLLKAGRIEIHPNTGNIMGIWWDMRIRISSNLSFFMDDLPIKSNETLHDGNAIIWVCYKKGYRRCSGKQPFLYCDMNFIAKWQHNRTAVSNLCNHTIYICIYGKNHLKPHLLNQSVHPFTNGNPGCNAWPASIVSLPKKAPAPLRPREMSFSWASNQQN
jgi:hypothetical protein